MDLQLHGMDGFELTRTLKRDPAMRDVVIIALTAYAMKGDERRALEAGCDGCIAKPIDTRALPGMIAGLPAAQLSGRGRLGATNLFSAPPVKGIDYLGMGSAGSEPTPTSV